LRDFAHGIGAVQAPLGLGRAAEVEAVLAAMPAELADQVRRLLAAVTSFQTVTIQARAFVPAVRN
jgi:hypothetical protein